MSMCTLIIFYKMFHGYPVVALHNRYEKRGTLEHPPTIMEGRFRVLCPLDVRSGGTWIGFNERGLFAAVTDQHTALPVKAEKSRGELMLTVLRNFSSAENAANYLKDNFGRGYKRGNFVVLDSEKGYHIIYDEKLIVRTMERGIHVITNLMAVPGIKIPYEAIETFELAEVRRKRAVELAENVPVNGIEKAILVIKKIAADHGEGKSRKSICYHDEMDWTMTSSIIIAVSKNLINSKILYCKGNPCENLFQDYSYIVKEALQSK